MKTKVKRLENFLDLWRNVVDQEHKNIGQTLDRYKTNLFGQVNSAFLESKKFSPIGDGELNYLLAKDYDTGGIVLNFSFED